MHNSERISIIKNECKSKLDGSGLLTLNQEFTTMECQTMVLALEEITH